MSGGRDPEEWWPRARMRPGPTVSVLRCRPGGPGNCARRLSSWPLVITGTREVSGRIHAILGDYTPLVEGISLDEAFLDVSGSERLFGSAPVIAVTIRNRIRAELALPCSVGVAPAKFLAKLASEAAKPTASLRGVVPGSGVFVIRPGEELQFLHPLPIEALWGVGPADRSPAAAPGRLHCRRPGPGPGGCAGRGSGASERQAVGTPGQRH